MFWSNSFATTTPSTRISLIGIKIKKKFNFYFRIAHSVIIFAAKNLQTFIKLGILYYG